MLTTITVNGSVGLRFLSDFGATFQGSMPPILAAIVAQARKRSDHDDRELVSLEVEPWLAEEIAAFVDDLIQSGDFDSKEPPLLFSADAGDLIVFVRDALVEVQTSNSPKAQPKTWRFLPRGTRGRLIARRANCGKILLLDAAGGEPFQHIYVSDRCITRARPTAARRIVRAAS